MSLSQEELLSLNWRKAKRSMSNGNCAEIALAAGAVAMRDSKDPKGPVLRYPEGAWRSFTTDARAGKFDVFRAQ